MVPGPGSTSQPKNKQPRTTPWPCRLQALDLQNRFHFQTREVARKTLNIASLREMKITVPSLSDQRSAIRKVVRAFAWIDRIALENHSRPQTCRSSLSCHPHQTVPRRACAAGPEG